MRHRVNDIDLETNRSDAVASEGLRLDGVLGEETLIQHLAAMRVELEAIATLRDDVRPLIRLLRRIPDRVARPVRIAVLGEFNTGKSSIANRLMDGEALPTSVIACTHVLTRVYYAERTIITARQRGSWKAIPTNGAIEYTGGLDRIDVGVPVAKLKDREIWDFPGVTRSNFHELQDAFRNCAPDIAIWCTDVAQAWKNSEQATWSEFRCSANPHEILAVTYCDLMEPKSGLSAVLQRLQELAGPEFSEIIMSGAIMPADWPQSSSSSPTQSIDGDREGIAIEDAVARVVAGIRGRRARTALKTVSRAAERLAARLSPSC